MKKKQQHIHIRSEDLYENRQAGSLPAKLFCPVVVITAFSRPTISFAIMNCDHDRRAVLIFDWDDTICPSSFVEQWKIEHFHELPQHVRE
jgi:hypothetical protein